MKYKTKESASLDKAVSELSTDKSGVSTELSAAMAFLKSIENQCIANAETHGERNNGPGVCNNVHVIISVLCKMLVFG